MIVRVVMAAMVCALATAPAVASAAVDPLAPADSPISRFDGETVTVQARSYIPAKPDVFGTAALDAGVTVYGARWRRVSNADAHDPRLTAMMAGAARLDPVAQLGFVQAAVRRRISWRRDLDVYHVSDYWAQAGETLDRGCGDSEDIAILKMQALKAVGFAPRDFYLSVGRDKVRGADTLLLVRVGERFYALDDRMDRPLAADGQARFVPVITLGKDRAWLHGKRYAGRSANRAMPPFVAANSAMTRTIPARPAIARSVPARQALVR